MSKFEIRFEIIEYSEFMALEFKASQSAFCAASSMGGLPFAASDKAIDITRSTSLFLSSGPKSFSLPDAMIDAKSALSFSFMPGVAL